MILLGMDEYINGWLFGIWNLMWNHVYGWKYEFAIIPLVYALM